MTWPWPAARQQAMASRAGEEVLLGASDLQEHQRAFKSSLFLQPAQLGLPPSPAPLKPWGLDSPCQDTAGSPTLPWALPATLASSEACRLSGGFLSCWLSGLRNGKELCQRWQPKPSFGTHLSCPAGWNPRELQGWNLHSLVIPTTASPSFSHSVPALAPSPVRSSIPPGLVDTAPSTVWTLTGLRAALCLC